MSFVSALQCKECGATYPVGAITVCEHDFGPLEVVYDYERLRKIVTREKIEAGPQSLWRYRDLLPISGSPRAGLRSGWTPLIKADRLAAELGVRELYIKDDSANYPTFSYKDRVVAVALTKAVEFGFDTIGCASTGNLSHSVAAHAAAAGLKAVVFIPHDIEEEKVIAAKVLGATVIKIQGTYDDVNRLCSQIADEYRWALVNVNLRPFYTEGAKTVGFEIAEQLGWKLPRHTVVPVAGGTILPKIWKAYREFTELGLVEDTAPVIHAGQARGCDPVITALKDQSAEVCPQKPHTIAKSIAIGNPADGRYVLQAVRASGGSGASVTDEENLQAIELLARTEGIFTEPAGGATLGAALQLIQSGKIPPDESICVCITGNGLKSVESFRGRFHDIPVIRAKLREFSELFEGGRVLPGVQDVEQLSIQ